MTIKWQEYPFVIRIKKTKLTEGGYLCFRGYACSFRFRDGHPMMVKELGKRWVSSDTWRRRVLRDFRRITRKATGTAA